MAQQQQQVGDLDQVRCLLPEEEPDAHEVIAPIKEQERHLLRPPPEHPEGLTP